MNKFQSIFGGLTVLAVFWCCIGSVNAQLTTIAITPTQDAYISSKFPTENYGTKTELNVSFGSRDGIYRSALKFDFSSIPANATIVSAQLRLKPNIALAVGTYTTHKLDRFVASWTETGIKYNNQPAIATGGIGVSTGDGVHRTFDVLSDVKNMIGGMFANEGWLLRLNNETVGYAGNFGSRENGTSANRPTLTIQYYLPIKINSAIVSHATNISSTNGSITPTISGGSGTFTYQWINGSTGSPISTSASLTGVGYGWYGLRIIDNTASIDHYMAFLVGVECGTATIDFKPGPEYVDDAQLYNLNKDGVNNGNLNFGSERNYLTENWSNGSTWYNRKNLMKFNLWVDNNADFDKADLYLYGNGHDPLSRSNISELLYVTDPWLESKVTYNTAPNSVSTPLTSIPGTSTTNENKVLDISDFWELWKANNNTNYGMLMQLQSYTNVYTRMQFYSSDIPTPANRPWIQFEINLEALAGCPSITPSWDVNAETGSLMVDITKFAGVGKPYQYVISTEPISELTESYDFIRDSLGLDIDSTQFFSGKENGQTYQFSGLDAGTYYVSVFNNNGDRIFNKSKHIHGSLVFDQQSGLSISGNQVNATAANGAGSLKLYMSDNTEYSGFETTLESITTSGEQFVGLANSTATITDYQGMAFGFRVQGNTLFTVKNGIATSVSGTLVAGDVLKVNQEGNTLTLLKNNTTILTETLPSTFTYKVALGTQPGALLLAQITGKYSIKPFRFYPAIINHLSCDQLQGSFSFSVNLLGALNGQTASYSIMNTSTNEVVAQDLTVLDQQSIAPISTLASGQPLTPGIYQVTLVIGGQTYVETMYFGYAVSWAQDISQYSQLPTSNSVKRNVATSQNSFSFARARNINTSGVGWVKFKARTGQNSPLAANSFMRFGYPNFYSPVSFSGSDAYLVFLPWVNNKMYVAYWDGQNYANITYLSQGTEFLIRYTNSQVRIYRNNALWQTFSTTSFNGITGVNCQSLTLNDAFENVITSYGCSPSQPESTVDHAELKKKLDGGYALAVEGLIKFTFDEEYEVIPSFLPFKIFNNQRNVVASSDISGNVTGGVSALSYQGSDGRYQIDLSTISGMNIGEFYTIEITTQKGDKQYLKFLFKN